MKTEVNPHDTTRAEAFDLWMTSPMPMVTLTKTFDITTLMKASKRWGIKLNTLLCWCIGKAATQVDEFYLLPEQGRLFRFDSIAINVIVRNCKGGINSCDIPFTPILNDFNQSYLGLTRQCATECKSSFLDQYMIVGTSAVVQTELDSIVNQYTDKFANPMLMWGKYRRRWLRTTLPISLQFHHVQMDGGEATAFLDILQKEIKQIKG